MTRKTKLLSFAGGQADGYLGLVTGTASAEIRAAVNDINIRRKQAYTRMARDKGESVENVGKVFALDLISRVPAGQMYKDGNGSWKRK